MMVLRNPNDDKAIQEMTRRLRIGSVRDRSCVGEVHGSVAILLGEANYPGWIPVAGGSRPGAGLRSGL